MIVLDASVLIALGNDRDVHHLRAREFMLSHLGDDLILHPLTKAEVLVGPMRRGIAGAKEREIDAMGIDEWVPHAGSGLRLAELRVRTGLKMPDCCVLDAALTTDSRLATFDVDLARVAEGYGIEVRGLDRVHE